MSDQSNLLLKRMPRAERDAMLIVAQGQPFNQFLELLIRGRTAYLDQSLENLAEDKVLVVGKLLGERSAYHYMRDRIIEFQRDIKRVNDAEDKQAEDTEKKTGKE